MSAYRADRTTPSAALWLVDGSRIRDKALARGIEQLSASEKQRFANFKRVERQRQYLIGHLLLRLACSRMLGVPPEAICAIDRPAAGPLLCLPEGMLAPGFSLSHSRQWIACAISVDTALGLDVEVIDAQRDVVALSEASFRPDEHRFIQSRNGDERTKAFYRIWTMKEALFKLSSNLNGRRMHPSVVDAHGELQAHGEEWFLSTMPHPSLCISICSAQALTEVTLIESSEFINAV